MAGGGIGDRDTIGSFRPCALKAAPASSISHREACRAERLMTLFDDRQNAFEAKFAHDEEMKFRVLARRDMLIGRWAAAKLGKTGEAAEAYAKLIVLADLEEAGDHDVIRKLVADLATIGIDESAVRAELAAQRGNAETQLMGEG